MAAVRTGLDRWLQEGPACAGLEARARVGLLAHAASVDAEAVHVIERLHESSVVRVERLFAPEHGIFGHEQDMESVDDRRDPLLGVPVISLYGSDPNSLRPRAEDLQDLDAVLFDLQDVGSRYYTYVYTLSFLMEACHAVGVPVVVLDRPNPIGGTLVEGPLLRPELASFVGRYPLPVRHGMTVGELAGMFRQGFGVDCELRVVTMQGWTRSMSFGDTGLPWVPPSPNMPGLGTALVYPGGCLVEGTNLSEGRGTTLPFELVGAPWLSAHDLARRMRAQRLPGVAFRAASFRPEGRKHAGTGCGGVQVVPTDPGRFRPFATYLVLLREARSLEPGRFDWRREPYEFETSRLAIDLLLGHPELRERLEAGADLTEMEECYRDEARAFDAERRAYLLYD